MASRTSIQAWSKYLDASTYNVAIKKKNSIFEFTEMFEYGFFLRDRKH